MKTPTASDPHSTYLSLEQVAEMTSLSIKTIRRRISDGTIPAYTCGRRIIRVRVEDLDAAFRRVPTVQP